MKAVRDALGGMPWSPARNGRLHESDGHLAETAPVSSQGGLRYHSTKLTVSQLDAVAHSLRGAQLRSLELWVRTAVSNPARRRHGLS